MSRLRKRAGHSILFLLALLLMAFVAGKAGARFSPKLRRIHSRLRRQRPKPGLALLPIGAPCCVISGAISKPRLKAPRNSARLRFSRG